MGQPAERRSGVGHYLGTEIEEKWWKRYYRNKLLARGNGKYWIDQESFCFHRYLTREPIRIRFADIVGVKIGTWHSGRWYLGWPIVKVLWMKDGVLLSSGFFVSKRRDISRGFADDLMQRAGGSRPGS